MIRSVTVVGASLAALRTVESLRRGGYDGTVRVIGDEPHLPYNRPPLSKTALLDGPAHSDLAFTLRDGVRDVEWLLGVRAISVDLDRYTVTCNDGATYVTDAIVLATGVRPRRLAGPGVPGRYTVRTVDDALALRAALGPGVRVAVAGAGFLGCEIATSARSLGSDVVVVGDELPMAARIGPRLSAELRGRHESAGVQFHVGRAVGVQGDESVEAVLLDDGSALACDVVVECVGSVPNTELLAGADVLLEPAVVTDSWLRVLRNDGQPHPRVFAVGDVAAFPHPVLGGRSQAVQHWNVAQDAGRYLGRQLAALARGEGAGEPLDLLPWFWSDQAGAHLLGHGYAQEGADFVPLGDGSAGDAACAVVHGGRLLGVVGLGQRGLLNRLRSQIGRPADAALAGVTG